MYLIVNKMCGKISKGESYSIHWGKLVGSCTYYMHLFSCDYQYCTELNLLDMTTTVLNLVICLVSIALPDSCPMFRKKRDHIQYCSFGTCQICKNVFLVC